MPNKWRSTSNTPGRSVSAVLLDFVFGEPMPQPEMVEHDSEQAWQEWLQAKAGQEAVVEFEDTQRMDDDDAKPPTQRN